MANYLCYHVVNAPFQGIWVGGFLRSTPGRVINTLYACWYYGYVHIEYTHVCPIKIFALVKLPAPQNGNSIKFARRSQKVNGDGGGSRLCLWPIKYVKLRGWPGWITSILRHYLYGQMPLAWRWHLGLSGCQKEDKWWSNPSMGSSKGYQVVSSIQLVMPWFHWVIRHSAGSKCNYISHIYSLMLAKLFVMQMCSQWNRKLRPS